MLRFFISAKPDINFKRVYGKEGWGDEMKQLGDIRLSISIDFRRLAY